MQEFFKKPIDVLDVISRSIENPKLAQYFSEEQWDVIWSHFGKPQKNLSSYHLLCGMVLYDQANKLVIEGADEKSEYVIACLKKAAHYYNFAAISTLNRFQCEKLNEGFWVHPQECFGPLFEAAKIHVTPIYLMIALTCIHYGNYHTGQTSDFYYEQALFYLKIAESSEPNDQNEIHNAYEGAGISESNPWRIGNIAGLREGLTALRS